MSDRKPHPKATQIGGFCSPKFKDGFKRCGVHWLPPAGDERPPQVFPVDKFSLEQREFLLNSVELDINERVSAEDAAQDAMDLALEDGAKLVEARKAELAIAHDELAVATRKFNEAEQALAEADASLAVHEKRARGGGRRHRRAEGLGSSPSVAPVPPGDSKPVPPPAPTGGPVVPPGGLIDGPGDLTGSPLGGPLPPSHEGQGPTEPSTAKVEGSSPTDTPAVMNTELVGKQEFVRGTPAPASPSSEKPTEPERPHNRGGRSR